MAEENSSQVVWLAVIGRTLAYLSMKEAEKDGEFKTLLDRVDFLEGLGLSSADAAGVAGSSKASVDELRRRARNRRAGGKNGSSKKKKR